jgi:hypothetical protein
MARPWTIDDIEKLKMLAQRRKAADIAAELGRSRGSTAVKAHQLGISLRVSPKGAAHPPRAGSQQLPRE